MENAEDRLGRERYSKRERKSRSVTTSKRSLQAEAGGRSAGTAHSQQLTLVTQTKAHGEAEGRARASLQKKSKGIP